MGNLTGTVSGKPVGFLPIPTPSPRRGVGNGKTEVGNSHHHQTTGNGKEGKAQPIWIHGAACPLQARVTPFVPSSLAPARAFAHPNGDR